MENHDAFIDELLSRLEAQWRERGDADLKELVPEKGHPQRRLALVTLIPVDQEYRWRSDNKKRVEAYLEEWPELRADNEAIVKLVEAECVTRADLGDRPSADEIHTRFPTLIGLIDLGRLVSGQKPTRDQVVPPQDLGRGDEPAETDLFSTTQIEKVGENIGHYHLLTVLGEGGFGTVYLAEQQRPVKRRVALKIIKPGMDSRQVIARFEAERQALAMMDHPNIAKVFDAGVTDTGRPYFVMELVQGEPVTSYCDRHRLTIDERLKLFVPICEAIQHAHQKGIIHRDIKPSNVLVTIRDDKAVPKIIDFGIAKAMAQPLTERTLFTEQGQLIGTPAYMSPEQAEMTGLDIDTRSDVYSLGVLLYELLTGTLPFDSASLRAAGLMGIAKVIREEEPPKPSTKISTLGDESEELAQRRRVSREVLRRRLRGDLDWIIMKTLEKDRRRRYATALDLADDLMRYERHEAVEAAPPGLVYRTRKVLRRYRVSFALSAILLLLAVAVTVAIGTAEIRAKRSLARQNRETITQLKAEADNHLAEGAFADAEEAYAKILGIDDTDNDARAGIDRARREQELSRDSELVRKYLNASRFDEALGAAESLALRFPEDERAKKLLREAQGIATLRVRFAIGTITAVTLQRLPTRITDKPQKIRPDQLLSPDGVDIAAAWYALKITYSQNVAVSEGIDSMEYFIKAPRAGSCSLDICEKIVGDTTNADFPSLAAALEKAKPGWTLILDGGKHDCQGLQISIPNLRIRSMDPEDTAIMSVGRETSEFRFKSTWDTKLAGVELQGISPEYLDARIAFEDCAFTEIRDCTLTSVCVSGTNCDGILLSANRFGCHDDEPFVHTRAYVASSRRVVFLGNHVFSTSSIGYATFHLTDCVGVLAIENHLERVALTGFKFSNCLYPLIVGNQIENMTEGAISVEISRAPLVVYNDLESNGDYNLLLARAGEATVSHNMFHGACTGAWLQSSYNSNYVSNLFADADSAFRFSGGAGNSISRNIFLGNDEIVVGERSFWGGAHFAENLMDKALSDTGLGNTRLSFADDNVVCSFRLVAPSPQFARFNVAGTKANKQPLNIKASRFGPALENKGLFLTAWRAIAKDIAACREPVVPTTLEGAIDEQLWLDMVKTCQGLTRILSVPGSVDQRPRHAEVAQDVAKSRLPRVSIDVNEGGTLPAAKLETMTDSIGLEFVLVPSGEFSMGSNSTAVRQILRGIQAEGWNPPFSGQLAAEIPKHRVRLTHPFYLSTREITVAQFRKFIQETGHETNAEKQNSDKNWHTPGWAQTDRYPVVQTSWNDATAFCRWLSKKEGAVYRLPTEAEWEYSARSGEQNLLTGITCLDATRDNAWWHGNSGGIPHEVGKKPPNRWGLYDMLGNVYEWCQDVFGTHYYEQSPVDDPLGPADGNFRVKRSTAYHNGFVGVRLACRQGGTPHSHDSYTGFRVVREYLATMPDGHVQLVERALEKPSESNNVSEKVGASPNTLESRSSFGESLVNSIGMTLVRISPGEFQMGSSAAGSVYFGILAKENNASKAELDAIASESPRHLVKITRPFWVAETEITVGQWSQFVDATGRLSGCEKRAAENGRNSRSASTLSSTWKTPGFDQDDSHPVVCIDWEDAVAFCRWLNKKEGKPYRLPTEAEWEYACRANNPFLYGWGEDRNAVTRYGWVMENATGTTHPVGRKDENPFGLRDMYGNVAEWCQDAFSLTYYDVSPLENPQGPESGETRVARGGHFDMPAIGCRATARLAYAPTGAPTIGFRVVLEDDPIKSPE